MVQPTLRQLEYFVAAVDGGSVTEAARRCAASQAAVSSALSDLERSLGLRVLSRRAAKGVQLTPSGEQILPIARRILDDVEELVAAADAEQGEVAGPLRVACTLALSARMLPMLAQRFAQQHPRVDLELVDGLALELQELTLSGGADACMLYARQLRPGFRTVRIRTALPYAVLPDAHPLADRDSVELAELADERLIIVQRAGSQGVVEALMQEAGIAPHSTWSFANPETVRAMVAHGLGYSIFSGRGSHSESFDGHGVRFVRLSDRVTPNEVVLAVPSDRPLTARLDALERVLLASATEPIDG
ncbi:LysR substrate-binding domain-containing protein [Agrococcus sp. Marseille-P2731]|uniref:LysR substrate-binding domain-containing protein n=1 Tax=Agrococcus sp. Marseille-P2731 TaxID=1841862 RepID=UPI000932025D|nr:LysR substrate-binding domain-containing protein [Agrococcus sp. Marseille-P2731]